MSHVRHQEFSYRVGCSQKLARHQTVQRCLWGDGGGGAGVYSCSCCGFLGGESCACSSIVLFSVVDLGCVLGKSSFLYRGKKHFFLPDWLSKDTIDGRA